MDHSFFDNANLGCSQHSFSDLPAALHDDSHVVVFEFALGNDEDSLVDVWVELLSHGTELVHIKLRQNLVHQLARHLLSFANVFVLILYLLNVFDSFDFLGVAVLQGQLKTVAHVQELLRELGDGELLAVFDLFKVPFDCVVILRKLVDQLFL